MEAHICLQSGEPHVLSTLREQLHMLGFPALETVKSLAKNETETIEGIESSCVF
jgi:hypothetical protein